MGLESILRSGYDMCMTLEEIQKSALELSETDRAALAADLLKSLPGVLVDEDDGLEVARKRSRELDANPEVGRSWAQIKSGLNR